MGDAVGYYFATARKFNGMIEVTSQDLSDIERSPVGPRILQNCATKYILKLNGRHEETCVSLGLTARDKSLRKTLLEVVTRPMRILEVLVAVKEAGYVTTMRKHEHFQTHAIRELRAAGFVLRGDKWHPV